MNKEFLAALDDLEKERGISKDVLLDALELALVSGYKKNYGSNQNVKVDINRETGDIKLYALLSIVETVEDPNTEIALEEARKESATYEVDDVFYHEVTPRDFGRIAAQTSKQVVMQRIREEERDKLYEEYRGQEDKIITGIVQRIDKGNVFVEIDKAEAILTPNDQIKGETYYPHERIHLYVSQVQNGTRGISVTISRSHPGFVKKLFEMQVPEIQDGIVEIKSVSREAGMRSKIAVFSKNSDVDAQGACIGPKGNRVQAVMDELGTEKIDIIKWSEDPAEFIAASIAPASASEVIILDKNEKSARVYVPESQLSLAIGKSGQNARLAARLTGWKIDIKSEETKAQEGVIE